MLMSNPDVSVRENRELSRYEAEIDGLIAIVEYNRIPGKIVVSHTEVPQKLEGRGIASAMYKTLLAAARTEKLHVIPVCPVFAVYIQRHPETHDLVDPGFRRSLGLPPLGEKD
jgi:predicted GNAT family acetyltransferase